MDLQRTVLQVADDRPAHIVDKPGARRSRCGIKDPLPVIWAPFVQRHVDGYGMPVCPTCAVDGWPGGPGALGW